MEEKEECEVCRSLHSQYNSEINATTSAADASSMQFYLRNHGDFHASSTRGCATCGFILNALKYFHPSARDATSVLMRMFSRGGCEVFMTEISSTIQIYTPSGTTPAWPGIIRGSELSTSSGSQRAFDFIKTCLGTCENQHPQCVPSPSKLPTRLIEVSQGDLSYVRLVETANLCGERYIALSYCWGKDGNVKTTTANYSNMQKAISVSKLPLTLQDAIQITRRLGVKYIWIDAICIIQDSSSDWEKESATMASVYRNSYLTIAAGTAAAANEGFLAHEYLAEDYPPPFQRPWRTKQGLESILAARMVPDLETHSEDDQDALPLDTRGWCFQERLLSTRTLMYKSSELYWTCLATNRCECGTQDQLPSQLIRGEGDNRIPYTSLFEITEQEAWDKWKLMVQEFAYRSLTKETDRLPAVAGLAIIVQAITKSEYIAGLWKDDLVLEMAWASGNHANASLSTFPCAQKEYIAPTFSWASSPEVFFYRSGLRFGTLHRGSTWFPKCKILGSGCIIRGENRLGQVESGFVRLEGGISRATLQTEVDEFLQGHYHWKVACGDVKLPFFADARLEECLATSADGAKERSVCRSPYGSRENVVQSGAPVFLLYLGQWVGIYASRRTWEQVYVLLGRSTQKAGAFERIGLVVESDYGEPKKPMGEYANFEKVEITII